MKIPKLNLKTLNIINLLLVLLILFFGGLGKNESLILFFLILYLLFIKIFFGDNFKNFSLPSGSKMYVLFLTLFILSFSWSKNLQASFSLFFLFLTGFVILLVSYNLSQIFKNLENNLILLGILFGIGTYLYYFADVNPLSLVNFAVSSHHHHIGDYWALVLIILGWKHIKKASFANVAFVLLGFYFLFLSLSRSSYMGLIFGSIYLLYKFKPIYPLKKNIIFYLYILGAIVLFFYAGSQKTTLQAHSGYLVQGIVGSLRNPFGVGAGGFEYISTDAKNSPFGLISATMSAHNIILEVTSGMGVLGVSFILWIYQALKSAIRKTSEEGILYGAIFITLGVNFMFDYTYLIPAMFWIWFLSLGISLSKTAK